MTELSREQIESKLKEYIDPYMEKDLVSTKCVRNVMIEGDQVVVDIVLGFPAGDYKEELAARLKEMVESIDGVAKAYSLQLLNRHEVVNDRTGETAYAAVW